MIKLSLWFVRSSILAVHTYLEGFIGRLVFTVLGSLESSAPALIVLTTAPFCVGFTELLFAALSISRVNVDSIPSSFAGFPRCSSSTSVN